jgi:hypothetical protein
VDRKTGLQTFQIDERYSLTLFSNRGDHQQQKGPIYVDSVLAVPVESFTENVLRPLPVDMSPEFLEQCSAENFANRPTNASDYCRGKIFSLTSDFNTAATACDCNPQGSVGFI